MDQKVVFDVKESSLDIIIPGVAINGLAFEDKKEADKFVKKYLSGPKYHVEDRVEKPVFSSLQDFEKTLKRRLTSLKKQLKELDVLRAKHPDENFDFDQLYIEYNIQKIEKFFRNAREIEIDTERV